MRRQDGYIIEKIVDSRQKKLCYSGRLVLAGMNAHLCGHLTLRGVQVIGIDTCARLCKSGNALLVLHLLCDVTDQCGQCGQGYASIELEVCLENMCWGTVHHGAQVVIQKACYVAPDCFMIQASICLLTVISRREIMGCQISKKEMVCCPPIPVYPKLPMLMPNS